MNKKLREHIIKENKYYNLLTDIPQYKPQGYCMKRKKNVVGIIRGNPAKYHPCDHLDFKYFNSWEDAYTQLVLNIKQ